MVHSINFIPFDFFGRLRATPQQEDQKQKNVSEALNFLSELFLGSAQFRLEPAQKFLIFPFGKRKVVVS